VKWHVDNNLLDRYIASDLDDVRAASIEAHVIACSECRARLARGVGPARIERVWHEIRDSIDTPRRRVIETLLVKFGMREYSARLVAVTPSLTGSWFAAVAFALAWAVFAAHAGTRGVLFFLVVAPLIPLAGIAFAFGPRIDPTYEVSVAAPMHGVRLLLLRAGCVLGSTLVLVGIASIGLPDIGWKAAAWLLPALAVSLATIALATWIDPLVAAGIVAFVWVASTSLSPLWHRGVPSLDRIAAFDPGGQALLAVLIGIAVIVLLARGRRFDLGRHA
jgi:hypothetical protein